jgi:hypothetical protein
VLDEGVELVLAVLVFVTLASDANADFAWDVADAVNPDGAVESSVNADLRGVHLLGGKATDVADAAGSAFLELDAVEHLVDVECVVAASGLHFSLSHLSCEFINNKTEIMINQVFRPPKTADVHSRRLKITNHCRGITCRSPRGLKQINPKAQETQEN